MKIKTSQLIDGPLDWAVATALGAKVVQQSGGPTWMLAGEMLGYTKSYLPSTDWEQGGPIIEREFIAVRGNPSWTAQYSVAVRAHHGGFRGYFLRAGPTPLIAAMRCFVGSKLGDEVDVPEELL